MGDFIIAKFLKGNKKLNIQKIYTIRYLQVAEYKFTVNKKQFKKVDNDYL